MNKSFRLLQAFTYLAVFIVLLAIIGTLLLHLPLMQSGQADLSLINLFFTALSASCLAGFTAIDIAKDLNIKGQLILILIMQSSAIIIIAYSGFLVKQYKFSDQKEFWKQLLKLLKGIIPFVITIELLGAFCLFAVWDQDMFDNLWQRLFFALFHSVSAFCNAGFSLFEQSFKNANSYIQLVMIVIIITGSVGYFTIRELIYPNYVRYRIQNSKANWSLNTQIVIYSTIILTVFASLLFFILSENTELRTFDKAVSAIFEAVAIRCAGFESIDISQFSLPIHYVIMLYMLIGTAYGSSGGGFKINLIFNIRSKSTIKLFVGSLIFILIALTIMLLSQKNIELNTIVFEIISAFTTSGLSIDNKVYYNTAGKIVLMICMFSGKIILLCLQINNRQVKKY